MCALAGLVARAAAQVAALEASAPALAAAATCPLRLADLAHANALGLLMPVAWAELVPAVTEGGGLTLGQARLIYRGAGAKVVATLASMVRRVVWTSLLAGAEQGGERLLARVALNLQALSALLACPLCVRAAADRRTAIREAAEG